MLHIQALNIYIYISIFIFVSIIQCFKLYSFIFLGMSSAMLFVEGALGRF